MPSLDPEMAARVWQRVCDQSGMQPKQAELPELIAEELQDAAVYRYLSRCFPHRTGTLLGKIARQEQSHAACLKGLHTLLTGTQPSLQIRPIPRQAPKALLRQCVSRELERAAEYEAMRTRAQYGQIFASLAMREREHCQILLALLGKLKK